jgi:hypothetical protein
MAEMDGVTELKSSELDEKELQQAIEKSAVKSKKIAPKPKTSTTKSETDKPDETAQKIPVIVKNRSSYVSRQATDEKTVSQSEPKFKAPSEVNKVVDVPENEEAGLLGGQKVEVKIERATTSPPSPEASETPKDSADTKITVSQEKTEVEPKSEKSAETEKSEEPEETQKLEETKETKESEAEVSKPGTTTAPPPAPPVVASSVTAKVLAKEVESESNKLQQPAVFDTTQYHLPIKPRSKHYMSNSIAWTILTLVFAGVGGYVMHRLGVVDIEQLKVW